MRNGCTRPNWGAEMEQVTQKTYAYPEFDYIQSAEQREGTLKRHPVVIVGAGPIGLTAALDCAQRGIPVLLLDDNNTVSIGSRVVCYAKRPLEIWDRLGVAAPMLAKGVRWQVGKVFLKDDLVNSGRLSTPTPYRDSSLNTADESAFSGSMRPGTNCADAPVRHAGQPNWLLNVLNTKLMLILANHVGDRELLREAIALARSNTLAKAGTAA